MIAVKINDPAMEKELNDMAKKQKTSRQAIVRALVAKQLEDQADYQAAVKAMESTGASIPLAEVMKRYGMEN